jgi:hypothetical protein
MADPTIWFSDRLHDIIDDINGPIAEAMIRMLDGNYLTKNELKIKKVDVSVTEGVGVFVDVSVGVTDGVGVGEVEGSGAQIELVKKVNPVIRESPDKTGVISE